MVWRLWGKRERRRRAGGRGICISFDCIAIPSPWRPWLVFPWLGLVFLFMQRWQYVTWLTFLSVSSSWIESWRRIKRRKEKKRGSEAFERFKRTTDTETAPLFILLISRDLFLTMRIYFFVTLKANIQKRCKPVTEANRAPSHPLRSVAMRYSCLQFITAATWDCRPLHGSLFVSACYSPGHTRWAEINGTTIHWKEKRKKMKLVYLFVCVCVSLHFILSHGMRRREKNKHQCARRI